MRAAILDTGFAPSGRIPAPVERRWEGILDDGKCHRRLAQFRKAFEHYRRQHPQFAQHVDPGRRINSGTGPAHAGPREHRNLVCQALTDELQNILPLGAGDEIAPHEVHGLALDLTLARRMARWIKRLLSTTLGRTYTSEGVAQFLVPLIVISRSHAHARCSAWPVESGKFATPRARRRCRITSMPLRLRRGEMRLDKLRAGGEV